MSFDKQRALDLLRTGAGLPDAAFREGQAEAIRYVVEGRGRLLVVQKTGWGKSFVYFIATRLLRDSGHGPSLLISPLLALMRNQIAAAERMGVRAATIHSDNVNDWHQIESAVRRDEVDILLISPERLANERFTSEVLTNVGERIALLVVDEAHCISDWGHDFRPHYRLIQRAIATLPDNLRVLATTATANDRVVQDLRTVLGPDIQVSRGDLSRPSLALQTITLSDQAERLAWLAEHVPKLPGSGIIYALTVRDVQEVAAWLKSQGLVVEPYTSETGERRVELENALLRNQVKALVATTALGMGFDKPDVGFVIHYQRPGSVIAYYQQVGRAGRALDAAYGVLLSGEEDDSITDHFIKSAFPTRNEVELVLDALEVASGGLSVPELLAEINVRKGRIEQTINLLSLESPAPIVKVGSKWQLTAAELSDAFWERAVRLTELRRSEQREMQQYARLATGHMAFLIQALDGERVDSIEPGLPVLSCVAEPSLVQRAVDFQRHRRRLIQPRKVWPAGGLPRYGVSGRIEPALQLEVGRALSVWRDAGWGVRVSDGKYRDGHFSDELVAACHRVIEEWNPTPRPTWVTCIPSRRHPSLVSDFGRRLAEAMNLPFDPVLSLKEDRPEQKTMENRTQQALNIDGAFAVEGSVRSAPVLLVDDVVDSRWTLTVAAWLLRSQGCGEVWPLVLAEAGVGR